MAVLIYFYLTMEYNLKFEICVPKKIKNILKYYYFVTELECLKK